VLHQRLGLAPPRPLALLADDPLGFFSSLCDLARLEEGGREEDLRLGQVAPFLDRAAEELRRFGVAAVLEVLEGALEVVGRDRVRFRRDGVAFLLAGRAALVLDRRAEGDRETRSSSGHQGGPARC